MERLRFCEWNELSKNRFGVSQGSSFWDCCSAWVAQRQRALLRLQLDVLHEPFWDCCSAWVARALQRQRALLRLQLDVLHCWVCCIAWLTNALEHQRTWAPR